MKMGGYLYGHVFSVSLFFKFIPSIMRFHNKIPVKRTQVIKEQLTMNEIKRPIVIVKEKSFFCNLIPSQKLLKPTQNV